MIRPRFHHPPRWGLFGLSVVGLGMFLGYFPLADQAQVQQARAIQFLTGAPFFIPLWVYAVAWLISGVMVAVAAVRRRPGWEGVGAIVFMSTLFGSFYILGWAVDTWAYHMNTRSYIVGLILLGLALYISGNVPPDPPSESGEKSPVVEKSDQ